MATFTTTRAGETFPVFKASGAGDLCCAYGTLTIGTNPADGDIYEMCRVPAGAVVVGGYIYAVDLDTNATETLDMDIGWADNGSDVADPDGFGNLGVWTGDVTVDVKPVVGNRFPLQGVLLTEGPKAFVNETVIQIEANAAAATAGTGVLSLVVYYVNP